jgi:cell division protein FtsL
MDKIKKKKNIKEIVFTIFLVIFLAFLLGVAIYSNMRITNQREQYKKKIEDLKEQIQDLENKKGSLDRAISEEGSSEHLEEVARKQYNLKSPGEEVVVVSKEGQDKAGSEKAVQPEQRKQQASIWNPFTWWGWLFGKK